MDCGLNLGPRELLTLGTVVSGLAVTWGMVRQQLKAAEEKFSSMTKELHEIQTRLDQIDGLTGRHEDKLKQHAIISSVSSLDKRSRFEADVSARVKNLEKLADANLKLHNGEHKATAVKEK